MNFVVFEFAKCYNLSSSKKEVIYLLSDNIRKYRKLNNMSQDELAEKLEVTRQSISLWETGQTQPTIDNVIALSKIFNISSDALLSSDVSVENTDCARASQDKAPIEEKNKKPWLFLIIIAAVAIVGVILLFALRFANHSEKDALGDSITTNPSTQSEYKADDEPSNEASTQTNVATESDTSSNPEVQQGDTDFDLFTYCKNFAIEKGEVSGDISMYQQPATLYGGYDNEYFSISYWGDSDMVEFCLHCPLSETLSINFYLRMRGGYDGKYEYLTSKYYRDSGKSLRSATGYIDPAVFSEKYPLSCDDYYGSTDGQTDFMEESRVGICDVIKCLKKFVEVENMDCDFTDFDFVNF